jgi:hypothetical protein
LSRTKAETTRVTRFSADSAIPASSKDSAMSPPAPALIEASFRMFLDAAPGKAGMNHLSRASNSMKDETNDRLR